MTSIDQAFVKAYARRNQSDREPREPGATGEDGSLQINQSAAQTASVWVDASNGPRLRNDPPETTGPKPHLELPPQRRATSGDPPRQTAAEYPSARAGEMPDPANQPAAEPAAGGSAPGGLAEPVGHAAQLESPLYAHATLAPELANLYAAPGPLTEPLTEPPAEPVMPPVADPPAPGQFHAPPAAVPEQPAAAPAAATPPRPFRAVWEVDRFETPETVARLFLNSTLFDQIGAQMAGAASDGLRSVWITSTKSGEGRSTTAVGTAMAAASAGLRVALVDADAGQPTLADDLRLDLEFGWLDALRGNLPIEEISVHGVEDHLTLIPLMPPPGSTAATAREIDQLVDELRRHFDLVILDGAPGAGMLVGQSVTAIDTALIVRDVTRTSAGEIHETSRRLRECGVQGVGVIENFS